jgi:hypothetical protein
MCMGGCGKTVSYAEQQSSYKTKEEIIKELKLKNAPIETENHIIVYV